MKAIAILVVTLVLLVWGCWLVYTNNSYAALSFVAAFVGTIVLRMSVPWSGGVLERPGWRGGPNVEHPPAPTGIGRLSGPISLVSLIGILVAVVRLLV